MDVDPVKRGPSAANGGGDDDWWWRRIFQLVVADQNFVLVGFSQLKNREQLWVLWQWIA